MPSLEATEPSQDSRNVNRATNIEPPPPANSTVDAKESQDAPVTPGSLAEMFAYWWTALIFGCAVGFMLTTSSPPGLTVAVNYLLLGTLIWQIAVYGWRRLNWRIGIRHLIGLMAMVLLLCGYYAYFDVYTYVWDRESAGEKVVYEDSHTRSTSDHPYHRKITIFRGGRPNFSMAGPMSKSGKQHGPWKYDDFERRDGDSRVWYWYGEEITEGEWHLRNK